MKQLFKAILIYSFLILFNEGPAVAQLYGIGFDDTVTVNSQLGGKDTVYVYNAADSAYTHPKNDLYSRRGAIKAWSPDRTSGWTFIWDQYDYAQKKFVAKDTVNLAGNNYETRNGLNSGGYQVRMNKGTIVDTFRAWVFINKLRLHLRKTPDGKISTFYSHCGYIQLGAIKKNDLGADTSLSYIHSDFYYANPVAENANTRFRNDTNVIWTSIPDAGYVEGKTQVNKYDPPTVITKFYISFSDTFGNTAKDTVSYDPIRTIADFDLYTFQNSKFDSMQIKDSTLAYAKVDSGEAPLRVKFKNKSKNGFSFEWFLLDTFHRDNNAIIKQTDYIPSKDSLDSVGYVYFRPIDVTPVPYKVKLFSYGPNRICIDSAIKTVTVHPSQLHSDNSTTSKDSGSNTLVFPPAFIPGDKLYGYFTYKEFVSKDTSGNESSQTNFFSIRSFHLTVFSQWGRLMYEYNGPVLNGWKGWDGKTRYGSDAPPGIYFYVYEAIGWGPISRPSTSLIGDFTAKGRGFVYLLRQR
jgi:hypothetical protein